MGEVLAEAGFADDGLDMPPAILLPDFKDQRLRLGRGTRYGSFVHEVFELVDFSSGRTHDGQDLGAAAQALAASHGLSREDGYVEELVRCMPRILSTPLDAAHGPEPLRGLPTGFTLAHIEKKDRLDELSFDLRLGAGTAYERRSVHAPAARGAARDRLVTRPGCVDPAAVYEALAAETCVEGVSSWLAAQRGRRDEGRALVGSIAGVLTGSIDLLFRAHGPEGPRYFLADYKTNRIESSQAFHYGGPWLAWKMAKTGYPLQALLYTVALHRHLGQRLVDYDYDRHVGGYLYLFLRGMAGSETPRSPEGGRCLGVFGHRWSRQTVEALDRALSSDAEAVR